MLKGHRRTHDCGVPQTKRLPNPLHLPTRTAEQHPGTNRRHHYLLSPRAKTEDKTGGISFSTPRALSILIEQLSNVFKALTSFGLRDESAGLWYNSRPNVQLAGRREQMRIALVSTLPLASQDAWLRVLRASLPPEHHVVPANEIKDRNSIDIAVLAGPLSENISELPRLRLIQSLWAGLDLTVTSKLPAGVPICRVVDQEQIAAMSRTVVAHCLSLYLRLPEYRKLQCERRWEPLPILPVSSTQICVLGLGHFGAAAATALSHIGFKVLGWRRTKHHEIPGVTQFAGPNQFQDAMKSASYLINLLPVTHETRRIISAGAMSLLPRGAVFINLSRGAIVDEDDLRRALNSGQISYAILDVFSTEPIPPEHWTWHHPRVLITPHVAAQINMTTAARTLRNNIIALEHGEPLANVMDISQGY